MTQRIEFYERFSNLWLKRNAHKIYLGHCETDHISMMFHIFTAADVAKITGRERSTVRAARIKGSILGIKKGNNYLYNLWGIKKCFLVKPRTNKTWTKNEINELRTTGNCKTRSNLACKTMRSKIKNGVRLY